jgi:hypothetical protein
MKIQFCNSGKSFSNARRSSRWHAVLALILSAFWARASRGDYGSGRGTVMDEQGAAIAEADVSFTIPTQIHSLDEIGATATITGLPLGAIAFITRGL